MSSKSRVRALLPFALFLAGCVAQSAHLVTVFGAHVNFFMAALPSLGAVSSTPAFLFLALVGIVILKATPAFEVVSLIFFVIAFGIMLAQRFVPLHPLLLHPALSVVGIGAFYGIADRTFFAARGVLLAESLTAALLSLVFTLLTVYATARQ